MNSRITLYDSPKLDIFTSMDSWDTFPIAQEIRVGNPLLRGLCKELYRSYPNGNYLPSFKGDIVILH